MKRLRLVTVHHLEVWDGQRWRGVAVFSGHELDRAKRLALEEAGMPETDDIQLYLVHDTEDIDLDE